MKHYWPGIAALSLLTACGGGVFTAEGDTDSGDGDGGTTTGGSAPPAIADDLETVSYNPGDGAGTPPTLTVTGLPFDAGVTTAQYVRDASLDIGDFQAFTFQASPGARKYTALVREQDGLVVATTGSGRLSQFFGGANFVRSGTYSDPTADSVPNNNTGNVVYSGNYAGIINITVPDGPDARRSVRTSGNVEITGDFGSNRSVIGEITNRRIEEGFAIDDGTGNSIVINNATPVQDLVFQAGTLEANGSFGGNIIARDQSDLGTYAGTFTGDGATAVGGAIRADDHIEALNALPTSIFEHGVFTATR